jgi:SAM-dependent methyltransferase
VTTADDDVVDATLTSTLDTLDDAVNYMRWIVDLARPALVGPILELGAGHGTFTAAFADVADVHAVEPGAHASARLSKRFASDHRVTVSAGTVDDLPAVEAYGSAVMINVLEHIEDDVEALRSIRTRLVPGGRLAIWVPAFQVLYSDFDRKLGHYRRYRKRDLRAVVERAGFVVDDLRYVNAPGFFSWLIITRFLKQEPTAGPLVRIFDRVVVPIVRRVESMIPPPFGQSILLVATSRR